MAKRPLVLRLRRVGRERLLRRRDEMRALTRPHGVLGTFGATATSAANGNVVSGGNGNVAGNGNGTGSGNVSSNVTGNASGNEIGVTGNSQAFVPGGATPGTLDSSFPPLPTTPPSPRAQSPTRGLLQRQEGFMLGDPGEGNNNSNYSTDSSRNSNSSSAGSVPGSEGAAEISPATRSGGVAAAATGAESGTGSAVVAAAAAAVVGGAAAGNWEAVEWAESCLLTVRHRRADSSRVRKYTKQRNKRGAFKGANHTHTIKKEKKIKTDENKATENKEIEYRENENKTKQKDSPRCCQCSGV